MSLGGRVGRADTTEPGRALSAQLCAVAMGDKAAFEAVYSATVDRVLGLATRIAHDRDLADDIASQVFVQIWREARRFDPARGSALGWIMTIARSRSLDAIRARGRALAKAAELQHEPDDAAHQNSPQDLLVAVNRESSLHRALRRLSADERQLLALAYFRGYSHAELARITKQPLGTIKSRIRRTLSKLRRLMETDRIGAGEPA